MQLRLSNSFINPDTSGDFEWTANMINLNDGKNDDLLDKCQPLKEYMILINEIRKNSVSMGFEDAVDTAVTDCIEHNILKRFLLKHRAEVLDVCITEYNEKSFVDGIREEGQNLLATVVLRLRNGETPEQILASGVDAKTIELAETIK